MMLHFDIASVTAAVCVAVGHFPGCGMTIPKRIHFRWFGRVVKPPMVRERIRTWQTVLPGYDIVEWTEGNLDTSLNKFAA